MNIKVFTKKYTMVIALIAVFITFSILTGGRLLVPQNLSNLLLQNAYVLIMACGMLLCILTGGNIDLLVIPLCLIIAGLIGIVQGLLIGHVHVPPFICTLAGMFFLRGLGRVILGSRTLIIEDETFFSIFASYINLPGLDDGEVKWSAFILGCIVLAFIIGQRIVSRFAKRKKGYPLIPVYREFIYVGIIGALILAYTWQLAHFRGISVMAVWVIAIVVIYEFITSKVVIGRHFYAVGGNEKAAKLSGIDTKRVYFRAYTSMSLLAGLAGLIVAARLGSVNGDTGSSFEMDAISACFIGGASAYGGSGTISGVVIGAVFLGVINQGMSIIGLDNNWQYMVKGAVLLTAVLFDVVSNRKTGKA